MQRLVYPLAGLAWWKRPVPSSPAPRRQVASNAFLPAGTKFIALGRGILIVERATMMKSSGGGPSNFGQVLTHLTVAFAVAISQRA